MKFKAIYGDTLFGIAAAVRERCNAFDHDHGAVEQAKATADRTAAMLAELIEMLVDKRVLDRNDVANLVNMELVQE